MIYKRCIYPSAGICNQTFFQNDGIIYISPTTFLIHKPDFNSIEELERFLDRFMIKN